MAKANKGKPKKSGFVDTTKTAVYALAIALFIRTFFVQAFRIPSGSMEDTLLVGDFLLVDKLTYGAKVPFTEWRLPGFRDPRRGDIIGSVRAAVMISATPSATLSPLVMSPAWMRSPSAPG